MSVCETYTPPAWLIGQKVNCARYGKVTVTNHNHRGWPMCRAGGQNEAAKECVILGPTAVRIVQTEAVKDAADILGVSRETVTRWRRILGVARMNPGTTRLWQELALQRLSLEARRRGGHIKKTGTTGRENT